MLVLATISARIVSTEERAWEAAGVVTLSIDGADMEIRVPRADLESWFALAVDRVRLEIRVVLP